MGVFWCASGVALGLAVTAAIGDWRRSHRRDLDRIGWVDWRTLHVLALIAMAICGALAWRG